MVERVTSGLNPKFWVEMVCQQCGTTFPARISNVKRGKMKHCARACLYKSMCTHAPVEFDNDVFILNPHHGYYESRRTGRRLNRVIWEIHHGPIPPGYKVYVKDGIRSNYAIENLYIRKLEPRPFCKNEGCKRKAWVRGLCQPHVKEVRTREGARSQER
jgi:hypothetical protein